MSGTILPKTLKTITNFKIRLGNPGVKRPLIFIHIPKCGGLSFTQYLAHNVANSRTEVFSANTLFTDLEAQHPDGFRSAYIARSEFVRTQLMRAKKNQIFMQHNCFYEFMKTGNYNFAVFLRDPIARILSHYYFFVENNYSFDDWLNSPHTHFNLQTSFLCGSPKITVSQSDLDQAKVNLHVFDFIGLVEHYDLSLHLFTKIFGLREPAVIPRTNVNLNKSYLESKLSPHEEAMLREKCRYDIELYEYARLLFTEKLRVAGLIAKDDYELR